MPPRAHDPLASPRLASHSFDNGSSVKKKLDNWQLLNKFFVKHQVPLNDKALIEDVVHCKDKAGVKFVCAMYTTLTARSVPDMDSLRITAGDEVPYFARPTASNLIKVPPPDHSSAPPWF